MEEVNDADSFYYYYKIRNNVDVVGKILLLTLNIKQMGFSEE